MPVPEQHWVPGRERPPLPPFPPPGGSSFHGPVQGELASQRPLVLFNAISFWLFLLLQSVGSERRGAWLEQ